METEQARAGSQGDSPQRTLDDGRVELTDSSQIAGSRFYNDELAPTPIEQRRWTTYNYAALWIGMAFCIPSYMLAAGLVTIGMNWVQAFITITAGNLVVLIPMLLNSHAGTKYGIPFPVFARAFFGLRGANLAALLRAFIACGWFGIQTWIGGQATYAIIGSLAGDGWRDAAALAGQPWTLWLAFALFWAVQMVIIWRGMEAVRKLENWAAPLMVAGLLLLLGYMLVKAGGLGPVLSQPSELGWGLGFWAVFTPSLMAMIAFWATLSLNMPDFTRFGAGQRTQATGQILGLPTSMSAIALLSILITSASAVVFGEPIWNPVDLISQLPNPVAVLVGLAIIILATISTNLAANVVSPSYDFSNALPRLISFRVGGLITGVIGVLIMPWELLANERIYIFGWLQFYGGVLAAVAGVLVGGYWIRNRTRLELTELYREGGAYWFTGGWDWRALVATVVGAVLAVGGAYSAPNPDGSPGGPFPEDGLIAFLKVLYDYSWVVGIVAAMTVYLLLCAFGGRGAPSAAPTSPAVAPASATVTEGEASV
ncbi:MAG: nitrate reductase [Micromonosporaceae bacterium]|nr:nitrate reductase [Micromonosporaceae bacterium]